MIHINLSELNIYQSNKSPMSSLRRSALVKIEGSVSKLDIQEISDMFCKGPIYLLTEEEAAEYLAFKLDEATTDAEIKEEKSNEE